MKSFMKFSSIFFTIFFFYSTPLFSQIMDTVWTKTFGGTNIDIGQCVQQTADSGYIITGYTRSYGTASGRNVWLIKTDNNGNMQWNNTFGGNNDEEGFSVKQTLDGGYIITGYTKSFGSGLSDVYLVKTDALGNLEWSKTFGGEQDEEGYAVLQNSDGSYLVAGVTSSSGAGSRDLWMIKTDPAGNLLWQKTHGGLSSDGAMYAEHTSDGGYIVTGWTLSFGPGALGNAWLVKTDSLGNQQWNKYFGGSDADRGNSVQQTSDGGYILTGYTASFGAGLYDMLLIKTDMLGNQEWMKTFGGTGRDYGNSVQQTSDGGYIVLGYTLSFGAGGDDFYLVKTDANGNEVWFKTFGGTASEVGYFVRQTNDGGFILTGHTLSFGAGLHDVWLIKLDNIVPVELLSFTSELIGNDVRLQWSTATETNNQGFQIERRNWQNEKNDNWNSVGFVNGNGTTTEIQSYSFTDENILAGQYQYRLKQVDYDGSFEYSNTIEITTGTLLQFSLGQNYPNPFNPSTKISWQTPVGGWQILKIYDVLGNEIAVLVDEYRDAGRYEAEFNASEVSSGIYFYRLITPRFDQVRKMILSK